MDFRCNLDESDYTRMIGNALKLETIRIILEIDEIADVEKVLILKNLMKTEKPKEKNTDDDLK